MAHNAMMPRFARASASSGGDTWMEGDNFDVEFLAECLLEDGNQFSQISSNSTNNSNNMMNTGNNTNFLLGKNYSLDQPARPVGGDCTGATPPSSSSAGSGLFSNSIGSVIPMSHQQSHLNVVDNQHLHQVLLQQQHQQQQQQQQQQQSVMAMHPALSMLGAAYGSLSNFNNTQQHPQQNLPQGMLVYDHSAGPDFKRPRIANSLTPSTNVPAISPTIPFSIQTTPSASTPSSMMTIQELALAAMQRQQHLHPHGRGSGAGIIGGRKKSQAQIDRRRERNRILARKTRLRKKFFFESLQKECMDLQQENIRLKSIVKDELDSTVSEKLLSECDAIEKMPPAVLEACGEGEENGLDMQDYNLVQSIQNSQHAFIITDPSLPDNPIVFASDDFLDVTGYSREQVLGRNCRFLQGTDTNIETVKQIRNAVSEGEDISATLINYKADGKPFWNRLFVAALRDSHNSIVNFIGVLVKVHGPESSTAYDDDHDEVIDSESANGNNEKKYTFTNDDNPNTHQLSHPDEDDNDDHNNNNNNNSIDDEDNDDDEFHHATHQSDC